METLNPQDNTAGQFQHWLAQTGGKADSDGLYVYWIGGNDLVAAMKQPANARAIVASSAASAGQQIGLMPAVSDISTTPMLLESLLTVGFGPLAP